MNTLRIDSILIMHLIRKEPQNMDFENIRLAFV